MALPRVAGGVLATTCANTLLATILSVQFCAARPSRLDSASAGRLREVRCSLIRHSTDAFSVAAGVPVDGAAVSVHGFAAACAGACTFEAVRRAFLRGG